ncbi:MAG: efflux RND transporter periplasmic adaptor subunit [Chthoniobacterales bacterium]
MKISFKPLVIGAIVMVLIAVWLTFGKPSFFSKDTKKEFPDDITSEVTKRNIQYDLTLTGEIAPGFQMDVKAEVGGKVKSIDVTAGQVVKKDQLLAVIDDTDLKTQENTVTRTIQGTLLQKEKAKGNFDRAQKLYDAKLVSKEIYVNLQSDYQIASNAYEIANQSLKAVRDQLAKTRILAPADGTVLSIPVTPGQVIIAAASVNSGTALITFADLSKLLINTHVNQMDADKIILNQEIFVSVSREEASLKAKIEFIAPLATVKNSIKGFDVTAAVKDPDHLLKPGMTVRMKVPVAHVENALCVPIAAVFREKNEHVIYVRNGETTEKRKVKVGVADLSYAQILSGVKEGEKVLLVDPKNIKSS